MYLCIKGTDDQYIPFFTVNGSFFSKIQENPKGGSSSLSIDEILQHVNYKEILDNDKNKESQLPTLDNQNSNNINNDKGPGTSGGGQVSLNIDNVIIENSTNNAEESALPEDFKNYLRHKLNKY